jgi:hypothetical protein
MMAVGKGWKAGWKINFDLRPVPCGECQIPATLAGLVSGKQEDGRGYNVRHHRSEKKFAALNFFPPLLS